MIKEKEQHRNLSTTSTDSVDKTVDQGRSVVVTIGINDYQHWPRLRNAVNDAKGIQTLFTETLGAVAPFPSLYNEQATKKAIESLIEDTLLKELQQNDSLILFFAGHGHTRLDQVGETKLEKGYLIPVEAEQEKLSNYIHIDHFLEKIGSLKSRHILVVLDACHSGFALGKAMEVYRSLSSYHKDLMTRVSRRVITSALYDQRALDGGPIPNHSLFTGTMIDSLIQGSADIDGNGIVTVSELGLFVQQRVAQSSNSRQTPDFGAFYLDQRGELIITLPGRSENESPKAISNFPLPSNSFVGREREKAELVGLLMKNEVRLLSIIGMGGIGKTQLALPVAYEVRDIFQDGVFFIALDEIQSASQMPSKIAQVLGLKLQSSEDVVLQLIHFIGGKNLLLVLDTYEHLLESTKLLVSLLNSCKNLKILVTSRERLNIKEETHFILEGLPIPSEEASFEEARRYASLQLFARRAKKIVDSFELDERNYVDVQQICKLIDGVPLAIELAAAWVDMLSLKEIAKELETTASVLKAQDKTIPARQQSIQDILEHSWQTLDTSEQDILIKCAVFHGSFDYEALQVITGSSLLQFRHLINKSLVRVLGQHRYDLHALLQRFCEGKLEQRPDLKAQTEIAHRQYYLELAKAYAKELEGQEPEDALRFFDYELPNLRAACERISDANILAEFIQSLKTYLQRRGLWSEQLIMSQRALDIAKQQGTTELQAIFLNSLAEFHNLTGSLREAETCLLESLKHQSETEITPLKAGTLNELGGVYYQRHEFSEALKYFQQSLGIYKHLNDEIKTSDVRNNIAAIHYQQGNFTQAIELWEETLSLQRDARDLSQQALILNNLGGAYRMMGDLELALVHFEKALKLHETVGNRVGQSVSLNNTGLIHFHRGDYDKALDVNNQVLILRKNLKNERGQALSLNNLAMVYERLGKLDEASRLLEEAIQFQENLNDKSNLMISFYNFSTVLLQQGNVPRAKVYAEQSLELANEANNLISIAYANIFLADIACHEREIEKAIGLYQRALSIQKNLNDRPGLTMSYNRLARASYLQAHYEEAETWANKALEEATQMRLKPELRFAKLTLANICKELGNYEKMKVCLEEVIELDKVLKHPELEKDTEFLKQVVQAASAVKQ
jgi:predicted ATPase/Tfp pilus assembly protein PilF